ncbi:phosphoglycerate dehydrogenase [Virgibacillus soli]|uniref:D-3-phosphoglycerate dehydrogenase n=1 Tax=Paracerasibacillus soli TaxID=480284 RepID=A0ABU5CMY8_9BACI|nr:phosphoglycerate dehydrogenase [Virgibacillus soli]MDY0407728.1 phosphoglycerate dehydrogenase [Virgibacillus soli]
MIYTVLITDPISEDGIQPLQLHPNIDVVIRNDLTEEELFTIIPNIHALLVRSQTNITRQLIEKANNLKIIARAGVGVDNIDLTAATAHGILVVNAPHANTNSAAEHTIAMLFSLARKIPQASISLKQREWNRKAFIGVELKGKTLGIIGLGRIGAEVAFRAIGQRMRVMAYDPFLTEEKGEELGILPASLDEVIEQSDFITIHTPLLENTKHLLDARAFQKMKTGVHIINCARGGIIDEHALYHAIQTNKVAGAALDVFQVEPPFHSNLLDLPEVIATPHLGASTVEAQENVAVEVSHDIIRFFTGKVVQNPVNVSSVPKEAMNQVAPYFTLSERLGQFLIHLADDVVEEINLFYSGPFTNFEVGPLTRNTIKGILQRHLGEQVNHVNALYLADQRGIKINENKTSSLKGFTNLITIEMITKQESFRISGTLLDGLGPRIVELNDYQVDIFPKGNIVLIYHHDLPGVIGKVGNLLGNYQINIATMQVDRSNLGGEAMMLLTVDKPLNVECLHTLKSLTEIYNVKTIQLI